MSDAPERITVSSHGFSFDVQADFNRAFKDQEYIRADLYTELEKDLAVANELLDHYRSGAH